MNIILGMVLLLNVCYTQSYSVRYELRSNTSYFTNAKVEMELELVEDSSYQRYVFKLKNKTGDNIKILWDDCLFIGWNRQYRVVSSEYKYDPNFNPQKPSVVPSGENLLHCFSPMVREGGVKLSVDQGYQDKESMERDMGYYTTATVRMYMTLLINKEIKTYKFCFNYTNR